MAPTPTDLLASVDPRERAALATLLALHELAHSDAHVDPREGALIETVLRDQFQMAPERTKALMSDTAQLRSGPADLVLLGSVLVQELPNGRDREAVAEALWRVVLADGTVTSMEDRLVNSMTILLGVSYGRVEEIKAALQDGG